MLRVKMSLTASSSSALRFVARDSNATTSPLPLTDGLPESRSPAAPPLPWLTSSVVPVSVSCRYTFVTASLSRSLRLSACDSNATKRPSAEIDGFAERAVGPHARAALADERRDARAGVAHEDVDDARCRRRC